MSEKNRVEIHDFKDWKAGVYLIEAGCGQGKNYFVFNTLFPYAHENGKRMLVFSNRVALREQQQAQTQEKDVKLITYQSLEHDEYLETMQDTKNKVRGLMQQVGEYDYIILDEAHYLYQDKERFRNTLKRLKSGSNIARYNTICTLTQNDDEQRVWAICREFWGNNEAPLNIENYDVKDLDAAYAKRLLNELESLLDKLGWAKE